MSSYKAILFVYNDAYKNNFIKPMSMEMGKKKPNKNNDEVENYIFHVSFYYLIFTDRIACTWEIPKGFLVLDNWILLSLIHI